MTCDQAELRMAELLLGELPAGERDRLERHLLDCASCRSDFELARAGARVEWADVPVPPALIESTLASLRQTPRAARFFRWAGAAAALVGMAILLVSSGRGTRTIPRAARGSEQISCAPEFPAAPPQAAACGLGRPAMPSTVQEPAVETLEARDEALRLWRNPGEPNGPHPGLVDLKIVMTWDGTSDVVLNVFEPDGTRINPPNRASKEGGVCIQENGQAPGPATVALVHAAPGTYRVGAHLHRGTRSVVKFVTVLYEGTPKEERREDTLVLEEAGEVPRFIREVVIP